MLLKSQRRAYISYDEGSKSVKYYNAAMRNILTSRNFCFLSPVESSPPEEIAIEPDAPLKGERGPSCKGEREGDTRSTAQETKGETKKRKAETNIDTREPQQTRGIRHDYRYLANPFPDEEEAGMVSIAKEEAFTVIPGDDCHSLKEA